MVTISYRPMTAEERAQLVQMKEPRGLVSGWVWLGIWIVILFIPWIVLSSKGQDVMPVLFFCTALLIIYAVTERWWKLRHKELPPAYQHDLAEGRVEVTRAEATGAVEVEEVEDLGLNFFLDVGDSKLLFLSGQYLYDLAHDIGEDEVERPGKFPNRTFDIIKAPHSRQLLGFECHREPFRPSRTYRVSEGERRFFDLQDGQLVSGTLSTLEEDLERLGITLEPCTGETVG